MAIIQQVGRNTGKRGRECDDARGGEAEEEEEEGEREGADMEMLSPGERGMDGMKERVRVPIASSNMTWRDWGLGFRV